MIRGSGNTEFVVYNEATSVSVNANVTFCGYQYNFKANRDEEVDMVKMPSWVPDKIGQGSLFMVCDPFKSLKPTRIIVNNKSTIVFWPDGEKTIVRCAEGEEFNLEVGVAEAIVRRVFGGNRSAFLKILEGAYFQPEPKKNEKKEE